MEPTDRPETYTDQLAKFKVSQATRETAEATALRNPGPPHDLSNGQLYAQCQLCSGAKLHDDKTLCPACERERAAKREANAEEERRVMGNGCRA